MTEHEYHPNINKYAIYANMGYAIDYQHFASLRSLREGLFAGPSSLKYNWY